MYRTPERLLDTGQGGFQCLSTILPANTWFEEYFEDRLAQIEHDLQVWALKVYFLEDRGTHDAILQKVRIALWRRFSENPEEWAVLPRERWLAYAKETFRWGVTAFHRDGIKWLGMVASDMDCMAEGRDITDDEALSMVYTDHANGGHFAYPREIQLADLRIDLEAAVERGLRRLCATQRRDMPKLISDLLEGYTLDETCERYGWTRNRGVTLMRKLRTVFYEEMSGEKKTGYLGSHHPLTDAEKQRIRELYATGLELPEGRRAGRTLTERGRERLQTLSAGTGRAGARAAQTGLELRGNRAAGRDAASPTSRGWRPPN